MKKKLVSLLGVMVLTASLFAGCGSTEEAAETTEEAVAEETAEPEESAEVEESADAEEGVHAPILDDFDAYDSIISGLEQGQYYAFATIGTEHDALLVTSYVFDNGDGNMAAIDAEIYDFDADGNIIDYGSVTSDGTAYPLAVYNNMLMFGGNHHVGLEYIDESVGSVITKEDATEEFDTEGNATYYWFSYDEEFEGEVEDNSKLVALYDDYAEAIVINFMAVE